MPAAAADTGTTTDVAIDAHYYDGGLKVVRLAGGTVAPLWVPADASDLVGLHEAFSLQPDDRAVEISRLRFGPQAVTWIAVYRRSQDVSYGDRGNYAGVGVWLLNQVVHEPKYLLDGLDTLCRTFVDTGIDGTRGVAARFLEPDNLPHELAPLAAMPSGLSGWTFSQDLLPVKELYEVIVAESERVAWQPVAEHILRMTLLPAPTTAHARSLILVRPAAGAGASAATGLKPLPTGFAAELAKALPAAFAEQQRNLMTMTRENQNATAHHDHLQQELAKTKAVQANSTLRIKDLERQLDASDPDGRFKAMGGTLARIDEQARANGLALEQVAQSVRQIQLKAGQTGGIGYIDVGGPRAASMPSDLSGQTGAPLLSGINRIPLQLQPPRYPRHWALIGIAALFIIAIGYLFYRIMRPDPTPSTTNLAPLATPREDQPDYGTYFANQSTNDDSDWQGDRSGDGGRHYEVDRSGSYNSVSGR